MDWQKYPLFRLLLPFVAGMLLADATAYFLSSHITALYISLCFSAIILFIQNGRKSRNSFYPKFGIAAMLFFLIFGAALYILEFHNIRSALSNQTNHGIVIQPPVRKAHSWATTIQADNDAKFIAYIDDDSDSTVLANISTGDTIRFFTRSFSPTCPLDQSKDDSTFATYRSYLFNSGISATCYISPDNWKVTHSDGGLHEIFSQWRSAMSEAYSNAGLTDEEGALLEALTTGNKSNLPRDLKTHYSRSGISHVLALSGFHLAVIFAMLNLIMSGIPLPYRWQWLKSLIIIGGLVTFTLLAGSPPSLVRAAVMCSLMSLCGCFGRPVLSVNSLTLAAFLMLGFSPLMLKDAGFQLSYISVLAICTVAVPCCKKIHELIFGINIKTLGKRILDYLAGVAIVSLACTLATAPLVAYHFHTIPLLSVLTNLLVSVLAVVLLYSAALWWIFFWWDGARLLLTAVLEHSARLINSVAEWISSFSWAVVAWSPTTLQLLLCYILITSAIAFFYRHTATSLKLTLIFLVALLATFL